MWWIFWKGSTVSEWFLFLEIPVWSMELLSLGVGFAAGFLVGGLSLVLYMRWKMMSQINAMQGEMEDMFDVTGDLMQEMDDVDDADFEVEEKKEE